MKATKKAMSPRRRQARYFCKVLDWIFTNICVCVTYIVHVTQKLCHTTQRAPVGFNTGFNQNFLGNA